MKILSIIACALIFIPQLAYGGVTPSTSDDLTSPISVITAKDKSEPIDFDALPFPDTL
ncbi:MAG: hypothetical protein V7782_13340 [Psychromonas sp.]